MDLVTLALSARTSRQFDRIGARRDAYLRLRRDAYVEREQWLALGPREQHLVRIHDVHSRRAAPPLICGLSAAAIWDLPIIGEWPELVQVMLPDGGPGTRPGVQRHRTTDLPVGVERDGLLVTPLTRTLTDLARARPEVGIGAADHALREGWCTPDELIRAALDIPVRSRGRTHAQAVMALADGRSESVGESLSRLRVWQLGFPRPELQVEFSDEEGLIGRVDAFWRGPGLVGEFDGRAKYGLHGLTQDALQAQLWQEKSREDRIRRSIDGGVARWTWTDAWRREPLGRILLAHGLRLDSTPWFDPITLTRL